MIDLLIHGRTFDRVVDALQPFRACIRPLVVRDGEITAAWGPAAENPVQPEIVFGNTDVYFGDAASRDTFIQTVLETKKLRWFQSSATGTDRALLKTFGRQAEIYTNAHGQAVAIAEYVLWQTLDFLRAGPERRANAEARAWRRLSARELSGLNWLIFGFGEIGRETAKRVRLLGGYIVGVRRTPGPDPDADQIIGPGGLHAALPAADVVLLCAPLTSETRNIADAAFFSNMREDALLINVGRGALVVESDLIAALDAGRPAFASLDVVAQEPAAPDNPLWAHSKVNLTAHDSPATRGSKQRNDQTFLDNLKRYLDGEPLQNIVPKSHFE